MKKIEALLVVHPCLEDNRHTAVDTCADLPSASDQAAGVRVASSPGPDYEPLDSDWSMARVGPVADTEGQHSASAADWGAVENFVLARKMASAAGAGAGADVGADIGTAGHNRLSPLGQAVGVVGIHLCHSQVPHQGYPYHCESIATIHGEDGLPAAQEREDLVVVDHPTISSVASRRLMTAPWSENSHSQCLPRLLNFRNSTYYLVLAGWTGVFRR